MQLDPAVKRASVRDKLHTAALALLIVPAAAASAEEASKDRIDVTTLLYNEQSRTQVVEPVVRFSHFMSGGQSISAQLGIDVITGASPSGALPSGTVQTRTSASGRTVRSAAGEIPMTGFNDRRIAFDAEWQKPFARFFKSTVSGHISREKDYDSTGVSALFSADMMRRLVTLTIGGGVSRDKVSPVGGTPAGLTTGAIISNAANDKNVSNVLVGLSGVVTRQWMLSVSATRTMESGYLTEPYKLISVMNRTTGAPIDQLTDKRPSTRERSAVQFGSVYHLANDVVYSSYRYYWDTWDVRSHTIDLKYRHELDPGAPEETGSYIEPLVRYYRQSAASFYTLGLTQGNLLPDFATSDYRLGGLQTITFGGTYGFHFADRPGLWTVRAQIIRQSSDSSPPVIGIQRNFDLTPSVNVFALVVGYSFDY